VPAAPHQGRRANRDRNGFVGVERLDKAPAQIGPVVIDDRDRDLAKELPEIGSRVEHAVEGGGAEMGARMGSTSKPTIGPFVRW